MGVLEEESRRRAVCRYLDSRVMANDEDLGLGWKLELWSNWRLIKRGTPGNLNSFEDILFAKNDMQDSPVIVAIIPNFCEAGCTIGLGYVDLAKRLLGIAEFHDDNHFTNVESALVSLGCKECVLPTEIAKSSECKPLYDVMAKCGVMVTERKKAELKAEI
ncbi:hypothetical protein E3N88_42818 [Mikania micrantha]|uniref:DNA mismatch repair protein MutS connector domain-containing protein n=1 Tax=Mikania micrantha TaxID=192012 RepID=A0A5N6LGM7_9ASTR|nr:hypothetical protein E3N88_42818 [Mikania micrantha]